MATTIAQTQPTETLEAIEQALAEHRPFADSSYILDQLQVSLTHRLEKVSARLPIAERLLSALEDASGTDLHHVIGDTVVRCAIVHAHIQFETGAPYGLPLDDCEAVMAATIRHLAEGRTDTPLDHDGSLRRLGPEPYHGWLWSDQHSDDVFGRSFRYLLKERYDALPGTPNADEIEVLTQGASLLEDLLPTLGPSALSHAHIIACVPSAGGWEGVASSSQFHLGGTIFLGRSMYSPWWAAEHLLHEALHQKLYDFRHAHSLLELDYGREDAPKVESPWNSPQLTRANRWDVHRVYAAFHVYVHLGLLAMVAEQRAAEFEDAYGAFHGMISSGKALERAHFLGEKLRDECWAELGLAGQGLADWLISVLEFLDPAQPPKGAYFHLSFDLYETEANRVAAALQASETVPSNVARSLLPIAKDEVERTRRILSTIGAQEELESFDDAVAELDEDLGANFPYVRRAIGTALLDAAPDRYRLTESGEHDQLVREMIEGASRRVYAALNDYPPAVAEAKQRANELRFTTSCRDDLGRVLGVLAAAVPAGGRILEIGTGAGVGTAWIVAGLGDRTDVELMSLEIDPALSAAVQSWPWPGYVQLVAADALDALEELGTFDVVFADAAPIKYGQIESVLRALRPSGFLLIDDLEAGPGQSEEHTAEKATLQGGVRHHPELQAVILTMSTGATVALASKRLSAEAAPDG